MYTYAELEKYTVKQLKILAKYEGISYPKGAKKAQMLDLLVQLPLLESEVRQDEQPCSARVRRIRDSRR